MKIKFLIFTFVIIAIITACKQGSEQAADTQSIEVEEPEFKSTRHAMVDVDLTDTTQYYLLSAPCAVVMFPDSTWVNNEQKKMTEEEWNTIIDDYGYYTSVAVDTLDGAGIRVYMDLTQKRYLLFKGEKQSFTLDNDELKETWALILFNGVDAPIEWHGTDIYSVLDSIYHK